MGDITGLGAITSVLSPLAGLVANIAGPASGAGAGSPGGISPQEAALAQFTAKAHLLRGETTLADTDTAVSTGATRLAGGAQAGGALQAANFSDRNAQAVGAANQAIAKAQGSLASSLAGTLSKGFSSSPGNFGPAQSTTTNVGG